MANVYLQGGPCNGKTVPLTPQDADQGQLVCGGDIYKNPYTGQRRRGLLVFKDAGPVPTSGGGGSSSHAPRAHSGWNDLRRTLNRDMPKALRTSEANTAAALRSLSRARRVRL